MANWLAGLADPSDEGEATTWVPQEQKEPRIRPAPTSTGPGGELAGQGNLRSFSVPSAVSTDQASVLD